MWLLHGTTLARAEGILLRGPNVDFVEPGGGAAENFSLTFGDTPSSLGESLTYARDKAGNNPSERGPALVAVDVPEDIVRMAIIEHLDAFAALGVIEYDNLAPVFDLVDLCGGYVQFDRGPALDRLLALWGSLEKEIRGAP